MRLWSPWGRLWNCMNPHRMRGGRRNSSLDPSRVCALTCLVLTLVLTLDFIATLPLALILASYSFHLVPTSKLKALRLSVSPAHYHPSIRLTALKILAHHLTSTITRAFESGSFLNS